MARGYAAIGLYNVKDPVNAGGVMRAAGCYGAALVVMSGTRAAGHLGSLKTDTMNAHRHIPLLTCSRLQEALPYGCIAVAVELADDAASLVDFHHPERAFYIFGPEDGSLDSEMLGWCPARVKIPTVRCMNLAATVNVVLYDRMAKAQRGRLDTGAPRG